MKSFLARLVLLLSFPVLASAALQSGKVQVGKISGSVTIADTASPRQPLVAGATFGEGSRIETGMDSTAELVFSNGASIVLTPNTLLELRTFRQVPSAAITDPYRQIEQDPSPSVTEVEVPRGKIIGEVRKLNALSTFTVKTPAGLVRIRGTVFAIEYRIGPDGMGSIVVSCVRGSVETTVYSSNVGAVSVEPGKQLAAASPSAALIARLADALSQVPAALLATASQPTRILVYPIPSEDMSELAALVGANSTLPPEVAATIASLVRAMPTRALIFSGPNGEPDPIIVTTILDVRPGEKITNRPPPKPESMTATGGGTTLDETLKKITDNVERSVESSQLPVSGVGN